MRRPAGPVLGLVGVLLALVAGCTTPSSKPVARTTTTTAGCGVVSPTNVVGLLGRDVRATVHGSVTALRRRHAPLSCRTTVPGHAERYVTLAATYHPQPLRLPRRACAAGWVYAGTPDKYTPACQDTVHGHGRTQLLVRWQPYVMRVTIGRSDRNWGGDPEIALAISRDLARRLRVPEAAAAR